jgi:hypothetical protein
MLSNQHTPKQKPTIREDLAIIAVLAPFLFWVFRLINMDFWYDEVFTLVFYTFVPLQETVANYSTPNNHIFFNFINNIFIRAIGIKDLYALMDQPFIIRILPLGYAIISLLYVYLIGRRFFNRFIALLAILILATTIPFYNFSVQVRGFSLSMMLLCMMLFHLWRLEERIGWIDALLFIISAALSLYAIPLNLYFILAVGIFYLSSGIITLARKQMIKKQQQYNNPKSALFVPGQCLYDKNRYLFISFLVAVAMVISALLYFQIIDKVLFNRFVKSHGFFYLPTLFTTMPLVFIYFISERYPVIIAAVSGLFLYAMSPDKKRPEVSRRTILLAVLLIMPFILSFIRGDRPYLRVFINLAPVFALLTSIGTFFLISAIPMLCQRLWLVTIVILLYCNLTFMCGLNMISNRLMSDIVTGRKSQDIYYNYYQRHYHPYKLLSDFTKQYDVSSTPIIACYYDEIALPHYLTKFGIRCYVNRAADIILHTEDRVYAITAFPNKFRAAIRQRYPRFQLKRINKEISFHNIFHLERNSS